MRNAVSPTENHLELAVMPAASESYLVSSLDLKSGLRVREILVNALPHEVVSELARMRRAWPAPKVVMHA